MANQIRDTPFGHLIRFLSSNKLLQYPDELDSSLYKKWVQANKDATVAHLHLDSQEHKQHKQDNRNSATLKEAANPAVPSPSDSSEEKENRPNASNHPMIDADKNIYLVGWYGLSDPEVCINGASTLTISHKDTRIRKIGPEPGNYSSHSTCVS
jgi:DHA1 family multidrug resistance protein-like MFS transporter